MYEFVLDLQNITQNDSSLVENIPVFWRILDTYRKI